MATIFIIVALTVLVANSVIMRSKTPWWRNPAALFRPEEPEAPVPNPAAADPRKSADWVRAAQARSAEMARAPMAAAPVVAAPVVAAPVVAAPVAAAPGSEAQRAVDPRELAPRSPAEAPPAVRALFEARDVAHAQPAMREDEPTTEVFGRVLDDEAPTQLLERIPAGYPDAHSMR